MSIDLTKLSAPFAPDKIHWRIGSTTKDKSKGMALAYIDARDVMERLDDVCGPENWQRRYVNSGNGRTCCEVGVCVRVVTGLNSTEDRWIWKSDGAGDTDVEGEKGAFSDAFKRAAVNWGIGRYLYDLPNVWVELEAKGRTHVIKDTELRRLQRSLGASNEPHPADVYVDAALKAIGALQTVDGIHNFWTSEADKRRSAGLTDAHVKRLKEANVKRKEALEAQAAA